jgi:hypothetical protein
VIGRIVMTTLSDEQAIGSPRMGRELVILPAPGKRFSRPDLHRFGAAGACLALAAAIGWGVGTYLASPQSPDGLMPQRSDVAQLTGPGEAQQRPDIRELSDQLRSLKASLAGVQASLERRPEDVKALRTSVEAIRQGLEAAKADTTIAIAQLAGKLDRGDQAAAQKLAQIAERLERLERKPDSMPVGSITPQPPARPVAIASSSPPAAAQPAKPAEVTAPQPRPKSPIPGYVLRDVYGGVALIEGGGIYREVMVGQAIPGAGKVEAIERHGRRWVVVTSQGVIN